MNAGQRGSDELKAACFSFIAAAFRVHRLQ
jgi:hypothetical protein